MLSIEVDSLSKIYTIKEISAAIYDNIHQPLIWLYLKLVEKTRGKEKVVYALDNVSFHARRGEILAVLGPNGSGKTTLLRILAGLALPTSGRARVEGLDVVEDNARLGDVVMYAPGLITVDLFAESNFTIRDNLLKYAKLIGAGKDRVDEVIALSGLQEYQDRLLYEVSTGIIGRLAFAYGILKEARVYLMDEPFTGISFEARKALMDIVRNVLAGKLRATVLIATHVLRDAEELSHRYIFLRKGRLVAQGDLPSLKERLKLKEKVEIEASLDPELLTQIALDAGAENYRVREGETGYILEFSVQKAGHILPQILASIYGRGGKVSTVKVSEPSLEEVYMELFKEEWEVPAAEGGDICSLVIS